MIRHGKSWDKTDFFEVFTIDQVYHIKKYRIPVRLKK